MRLFSFPPSLQKNESTEEAADSSSGDDERKFNALPLKEPDNDCDVDEIDEADEAERLNKDTHIVLD